MADTKIGQTIDTIKAAYDPKVIAAYETLKKSHVLPLYIPKDHLSGFLDLMCQLPKDDDGNVVPERLNHFKQTLTDAKTITNILEQILKQTAGKFTLKNLTPIITALVNTFLSMRLHLSHAFNHRLQDDNAEMIGTLVGLGLNSLQAHQYAGWLHGIEEFLAGHDNLIIRAPIKTEAILRKPLEEAVPGDLTNLTDRQYHDADISGIIYSKLLPPLEAFFNTADLVVAKLTNAQRATIKDHTALKKHFFTKLSVEQLQQLFTNDEILAFLNEHKDWITKVIAKKAAMLNVNWAKQHVMERLIQFEFTFVNKHKADLEAARFIEDNAEWMLSPGTGFNRDAKLKAAILIYPEWVKSNSDAMLTVLSRLPHSFLSSKGRSDTLRLSLYIHNYTHAVCEHAFVNAALINSTTIIEQKTAAEIKQYCDKITHDRTPQQVTQALAQALVLRPYETERYTGNEKEDLASLAYFKQLLLSAEWPRETGGAVVEGKTLSAAAFSVFEKIERQEQKLHLARLVNAEIRRYEEHLEEILVKACDEHFDIFMQNGGYIKNLGVEKGRARYNLDRIVTDTLEILTNGRVSGNAPRNPSTQPTVKLTDHARLANVARRSRDFRLACAKLGELKRVRNAVSYTNETRTGPNEETLDNTIINTRGALQTAKPILEKHRDGFFTRLVKGFAYAVAFVFTLGQSEKIKKGVFGAKGRLAHDHILAKVNAPVTPLTEKTLITAPAVTADPILLVEEENVKAAHKDALAEDEDPSVAIAASSLTLVDSSIESESLSGSETSDEEVDENESPLTVAVKDPAAASEANGKSRPSATPNPATVHGTTFATPTSCGAEVLRVREEQARRGIHTPPTRIIR